MRSSLFTLGVIVVWGCGPPAPPTSASVRALALDMGEIGVVPTPAQHAAAYRAACESGWSLACEPAWTSAAGPDRVALVGALERPCQRGDRMACLAVSWAMTRVVPGVPSRLAPGAMIAPLVEGCEGDVASSCSELARRVRFGVGVEQDPARASDLARRGCADGDPIGCRLHGILLLEALDGPPDTETAQALLSGACEAGDQVACVHLARGFLGGRFGPASIDEARSVLEASCGKAAPESCGRLHQLGEQGVRGVVVPVATITQFEEACAAGRSTGCTAEGRALLEGWAGRQEHDLGIRLLRSTCEGGDAVACTAWAEGYAFGAGVDSFDELAATARQGGCSLGDGEACGVLGATLGLEDALSVLERGCEGSSGVACMWLGEALQQRPGPGPNGASAQAAYRRSCDLGYADACSAAGRRLADSDPDQAERLHAQACEMGSATGCNNLGFFLEQIRGDVARARSLYTRACEVYAHPAGCTNLGRLYRKGSGVEVDPVRAASLYRRACESDFATACHNLGWLHERGIGVPEDLTRAGSLYRAACRGGAEEGCRSRDRLLAGKK